MRDLRSITQLIIDFDETFVEVKAGVIDRIVLLQKIHDHPDIEYMLNVIGLKQLKGFTDRLLEEDPKLYNALMIRTLELSRIHDRGSRYTYTDLP